MEDILQLQEKLWQIINEAIMWAAAEEEKTGEWSDLDAYPQYQSIREIGQKLHRLEGFKGMLKGHDHIKANNSYAGSLIERIWNGIGGWKS